MEQIHIDTLTKFRKEIIDNVLVHNKIIKPLQIQGILKIEDVNEIQNGKNEEGGETSKLLDILPRYLLLHMHIILKYKLKLLKKLIFSILCMPFFCWYYDIDFIK